MSLVPWSNFPSLVTSHFEAPGLRCLDPKASRLQEVTNNPKTILDMRICSWTLNGYMVFAAQKSHKLVFSGAVEINNGRGEFNTFHFSEMSLAMSFTLYIFLDVVASF